MKTLILFLSASLALRGACRSETIPSEPRSEALRMIESRRSKCLKALEADAPEMRRRALQELTWAIDRSSQFMTNLLHLLRRSDLTAAEEQDLLLALQHCGAGNAGFVKLGLGSTNINEGNVCWVILALGMMGDQGKEFIPFLLERVKGSNCPPDVNIVGRVVLATLGHDAASNAQAALNIVKAGGPDSTTALWALGNLGGEYWANQALVDAASAYIAVGDPRNAGYAALFIGRLGSRAKSTLTALDAYLKKAKPDGYYRTQQALIADVAQAKIKAGSSAWKPRSVLKLAGYEGATLDGPMEYVLTEITHCLLDERDAKSIIAALKDRDEEVVAGAAKFCWAFGVRAAWAEAHLITAFKKAKTDNARLALAQALGAVASEDRVPELRRLAEAERDTQVQEELKRSIALILLEQENR